MKKIIMMLAGFFIATTALASKNSITSLHITGDVSVTIKGLRSGDRSPSKIQQIDRKQVSSSIKNHVLYLRALAPNRVGQPTPTVTVQMHQLDRLEVYGRSTVIGKNISSPALKIRSDNNKLIQLDGKMNSVSINNYGPGDIKLRWVSGKTVTVYSVGGLVELAGTADQFRVKLRNHAVVDAQYLRAKSVLAQTKDFAIAKVMPLESLRAFASGFSNIYFYKSPENLSRYSIQSGNILQLGSQR